MVLAFWPKYYNSCIKGMLSLRPLLFTFFLCLKCGTKQLRDYAQEIKAHQTWI